MQLKSWKSLAIIGLIGVLILGGVGTVVVAAKNHGPAMADGPTVNLNETLQHNLTVWVGAKIEGKVVPIQGAKVAAWSMTAIWSENNTTFTVTFHKAAEGVTDANGTTKFNLSEGKYLIVAGYHGLKSVAKMHLDGDETIRMRLHNLDCRFMEKEKEDRQVIQIVSQL